MTHAGHKVPVRALVLFSLLSGSLVGLAVKMAPPALADNCSTEQTIFVYDTTTTSSYGTQGNIYILNHFLDPNCSGLRAWSMVNIFSQDASQQVETGYRQYDGATFDGVTCYQFSFTNESCRLWNNVVTITPGFFDGFRTEHYPVNSSQFVTWVNGLCSGCNWIETSSADMPFTNGYSMGETGRYGDSSGMLDHHKDLGRKDSSNAWHGWGGQAKWSKSLDNNEFYYFKLTDANYEICATGGPCPWQ